MLFALARTQAAVADEVRRVVVMLSHLWGNLPGVLRLSGAASSEISIRNTVTDNALPKIFLSLNVENGISRQEEPGH